MRSPQITDGFFSSSSEGQFPWIHLFRQGTQLLSTLSILAWVPTNLGKIGALFILWAVSFGSVTRREISLAAAVSLFFSAMNGFAIHNGVFRFSHPDFAGMPVYEFFMWGFYVLHMTRTLGGRVPRSSPWAPLPVAILFALPFALIQNSTQLTATSGAALAIALVFFHDRWDLSFATYGLMLGGLIEWTGVTAGLWSYPEGVIPLWSATMWAGVGLFVRRLIVPLLSANQD